VFDRDRNDASTRLDDADDQAPANDPRLANVSRPPGFNDPFEPAVAFLHLVQFVKYVRKYGYIVPDSLDVWAYRRRLIALDPACLNALGPQGALTLDELTVSLNRDGALRLLSEKTGIRQIAADTVRDWIELARRRGLVAHWGEAGTADNRHSNDPNPRWMLSERGHEELLTPLQRFAKNNSPAALLGAIFGGGAIFGAVASNSTLLAIVLIVAFAVGYVLLLSLYSRRDQRRNGPGAAVVAIETVRSSSRTIPALPLTD
jgi:hypothetical protein